MKLATWNVNSLNVRMPRVLEFLEAHAPDVVFLQETKSDPDKFPVPELEAAGYRVAHHSAGRWAGVAVLARGVEPEDVCAGLAGEPAADEARWLEATVGGIRCVSVYVPNGRAVDSPTYADKLRFLEAMAERVGELGAPAVVAGDFNVCPTDTDVYDPAAFVGSTHVTPPERERFFALLEAGLVDAYRHVHPEPEVGFTWWDYRQGHFHRKMGLRIDALLMTPDLAGRVVECGIDRGFRKGPKPSDHAPLLAELSS
jgi:exodeoxyribonuclease III